MANKLGAMRDSIPATKLKKAREAYEATGDKRPWHTLSAIEQQTWVDHV